MASPPLSERQRAALRDLVQEAAARAQREQETDRVFRSATDAAQTEHAEARARLEEHFASEQAAAEQRFEEARTGIATQFETDHRAAAQEYSAAKHRANYLYTTAKDKIESDFKESRWTITTLYDSDKKVAKEQHSKTQAKIDATLPKVDASYQDSFHLLIRWQMADLNPAINEHAAAGQADPFHTLQQCAVKAEESFDSLKSLTIPRLLKGTRFTLLMLILWALGTAPAFLIEDWYYWVLGSSAVALILGVIVHTWLGQRSRRRAAALFQIAGQALADAKTLCRTCHEIARATYKGQRAASKQQGEQSLQQALRKSREQLRDVAARRHAERQQAKQTFTPLLAEIIQRRAHELGRADLEFQQQITDLTGARDEELAQINNHFALRQDEINHRHANAWAQLAGDWKQAAEKFSGVVRA